jgi:hypothetical protein
LDSCLRFGTLPFEDVVIRTQQPARWKTKKPSLDGHMEAFFSPYLQKKAGGKITLSLLVNKDGKVCLYEVRPNSNVRPDFKLLKSWIEQYDWEPAQQNEVPVSSIKILQVTFAGNKISVVDLQ